MRLNALTNGQLAEWSSWSVRLPAVRPVWELCSLAVPAAAGLKTFSPMGQAFHQKKHHSARRTPE